MPSTGQKRGTVLFVCCPEKVGVVCAESGDRFGKGDFAESAAIPLNVAFAVGAELAYYVVTAFAGHGAFLLAF